MIKGILFDKDGTLIDFEKTYAPGTIEVIRNLAKGDPVLMSVLAMSVDLDLETERFDRSSVVIAGTGRQIAEFWLPHLPGWEIYPLAIEVDRLYTELTEKHVAPFDDLGSSIQALKELGIELGVATNDAEASAHRHIAKIDHAKDFPFVVGYDSGYGPKPEPGMVLAFAQAINADVSQVIMVGDSTHDLQAGRAAGAISVAVTTGMATKDDLKPFADHVIDGLSELAQLAKTYS